jgi:hypothetical protein
MLINKRMRLVLFRSLNASRARFLAFGFALLLLACSPKFDWRTIKNESLGYAALFPGKPKLIERTLTYEQQTLKQSLEFVKVDEDVFAVMTTEIPVVLINQVQQIEDLLKSVLLQQAISPNQALPPAFSRIKESSSRIGPLAQTKQSSQDYFLDLPQTKRVMRIRWLARPMINGGLYLYQVSVIRSISKSSMSKPIELYLEQENINTFFDEFRPN